MMEAATTEPHLKPLIPPSIVLRVAATSPPIRQLAIPKITEEGAWNLFCQSNPPLEQQETVRKWIAAAEQRGVHPFSTHKEEYEEMIKQRTEEKEESQDITEEPEEVSAVEYTPEDETEFLTLMAKRDKAQGQVNPTGTWSEEENVRLRELFHRRQQHEQEARR